MITTNCPITTDCTQNASQTPRTPAQARAERAARRAPARPVTDADTDALLGLYDKDAEYPALTSRNMKRREDRDRDKRESENPTEKGGDDGEFTDWFNPNSPNYNKAVPNTHVTNTVLDDLAARDLEQLLRALCLSPGETEIVHSRLAGATFEEIAQEQGTNKQAIHRRAMNVRLKMAEYQNEDQSYGLASVYRAETNRHLYRALAGGVRQAGASCDCARQQARRQQDTARGASAGSHAFFCENCGRKFTEGEWKELVGA